MSGIAGIARRYPTGVAAESIGRMAAAIQHRGPDGYGFYIGQTVGLAHVRLSVVDIAGGAQPLANEDGRVIVTYNGEVYNHRELRLELERRGHLFRTRCDSEVLVHGYEEWGAELLHRLDGQFAFAIYDRNREIVFVARDRFGVRPLFYAQRSGDFYFGSEIKAILASGEVEPLLDPRGLDEVLTLGSARPPRTPFSGIASLEPGTYAIWKDGALWLRHYYELDYPEAGEAPADMIEQLDEIMLRSVGMRLRADVPVGSHVDGGLNSSITTSLSASASHHTLQTFSMTVGDSPSETGASQRGARAAESAHAISVRRETIAESFPDVVWHAETPLLSTASAVMYHLARVTKQSGIKVVLRGDGADELFLGSDVFKEMSVREFCARNAESLTRPRLFGRIHPQLIDSSDARDFWHTCVDSGRPGDPLFSHLPRFLNSPVREGYNQEFMESLAGIDVIAELRASLPTRFFAWSPLNRAAYLEMTTVLSSQFLSSQGDRAAMAHGVELRYPFLDHRVFEFASALPTSSRLQGLKGKQVLQRWAARVLPTGTAVRPKRVTRPNAPELFPSTLPSWMIDHITPEAIGRVGMFLPSAVNRLVQRHQAGLATGYRDHEALLGVISTQLLHHRFIQTKLSVEPLPLTGASVVLGDEAPDFSSSDLAARADQRI
jgi:asparagine synthase (glutamine-hydrolysing)